MMNKNYMSCIRTGEIETAEFDSFFVGEPNFFGVAFRPIEFVRRTFHWFEEYADVVEISVDHWCKSEVQNNYEAGNEKGNEAQDVGS